MSDVRFDSSTSHSNSPPEIEASRPFFARPLLPYEGCNTALLAMDTRKILCEIDDKALTDSGGKEGWMNRFRTDIASSATCDGSAGQHPALIVPASLICAHDQLSN
jgi:hypothetical protein